jgi:adenosine deaminase
MATPAALERVAYEAAEDARADGCVLAEFRVAALLFEAHGVAGEAVVEALLTGLARSTLPSGLIVCAMRDLPQSESLRAAQLALRYQRHGVVGFDLAGAERGHPAAEHARALALCRDAGLPLTLHAGEADAAERVIEAVRLGARRIGHGVHLVDALADPSRRALIDELRERDVHLEVCPTSNVHTGAAASIATHPITALWRAGVSLSFHTDNRLMSRITHSGEALALLRHAQLDAADLLAMGLEAARHAFVAAPVRDAAQGRLRGWAAREGLPLPSAPR